MVVGFAAYPSMMFLVLLAGHALGDFAAQTEYMAFGKDRHSTDREGERKNRHWFPILLAHSLIHALFVALATGYAWLGWAELAAHFLIDDAKCAKRFGYEADQALHYGCKILWGVIAVILFQNNL